MLKLYNVINATPCIHASWNVKNSSSL